jgi:hypothetical protein
MFTISCFLKTLRTVASGHGNVSLLNLLFVFKNGVSPIVKFALIFGSKNKMRRKFGSKAGLVILCDLCVAERGEIRCSNPASSLGNEEYPWPNGWSLFKPH